MSTINRPAVVHCESLKEVRDHIDVIDTEIMQRIAQRSGYVAQAARIKPSADRIVDVERIEAIIQRVRQLAIEQSAPPDVAEATYRAMIDAFIAFERVEFARLHQGAVT